MRDNFATQSPTSWTDLTNAGAWARRHARRCSTLIAWRHTRRAWPNIWRTWRWVVGRPPESLARGLTGGSSGGVLSAGGDARPQRRQRDRHQPHCIRQVSAQQTPGLAGQPVSPLEAGRLHPAGRSPATTGDEVEHAADTDRDRDWKPFSVQIDPSLLLGMAEGDQEQVRPGLIDPGEDFGIVHILNRGPRRLVGAGNHEAGVQALQAGAGVRSDASLPAEQEYPPTCLGGLAEQGWDEVG